MKPLTKMLKKLFTLKKERFTFLDVLTLAACIGVCLAVLIPTIENLELPSYFLIGSIVAGVVVGVLLFVQFINFLQFILVQGLISNKGRGKADGQYSLSGFYYKGWGVQQSYTEAAKWCRMAADQGHAGAQFNLGCFYQEGEGVSRDEIEGMKWIRMAAEQGHDVAQAELGRLYAEGVGIEKDETEAVKWYRMAAEQGIAVAEEALAKLEQNA